MKKQGFIKSEKGRKIDNIPNGGIGTGLYKIDFYGCWWEVARKNGTKFWMIGEYPNEKKI